MASTGAAASATPGRIGARLNAEQIRLVGLAMIVISVVWRMQVALRGSLAADDYVLISQAAESKLTITHLLAPYQDHLMPAGRLITWLVTAQFGPVYWPYVLLMAAGQAILGIAFLRLLRRLLRRSWLLLLPLGVLLFSPLTLEATSWWAVGGTVLPMLIAMVLAVTAQVDYVQTGRRRHLVRLALAVGVGVLFFDRAILAVALVFLLTAARYPDGGPLRSIATTLRRWWPSWLLLAVLTAGSVAAHVATVGSSLRRPQSAGEVFSFLTQLLGSTLLPGLVGGPWQWLRAGDGAPVTAPPQFAGWISAAIVAVLVVATVRHRRGAGRAWLLLGGYLVIAMGVLAATRLGSAFSEVAGSVPRYVSDVVVVGAICLGLAVVGAAPATAETPEHGDPPEPAAPQRSREALPALLAVVLVAGCLSTAWSTAGFSDSWAEKAGRSYLDTVRIELASAPPDTVFFDGPVPESVVPALSWPYNQQSRFFRAFDTRPTFVDEADHVSVLDGLGRIRLATVVGSATLPGPAEGCGYLVSAGQTVRMTLDQPRDEWHWVVRIGYRSAAEGTATVRFGTASAEFPVRQGLHQRFLRIVGGGPTVELTVAGDDMSLCVSEIAIGDPAPESE
ncbi:hypothetical protein QQG74_30365 [Micromonospora sp. FIMYZ51]|uniref:hypothetical protein n=1 Tax=Micromonospora sp. FIMYZ51 TaxID=3051832 RepID=UPI00311D6292